MAKLKYTQKFLLNYTYINFVQGKHIGRLGHQDPGEFPEEVKALFEKAVQYYEDNMMLMVEIGDRAAQGRACGNLGNVHYLLGNFSRAIHFHQERLKIAKEFRYRNIVYIIGFYTLVDNVSSIS